MVTIPTEKAMADPDNARNIVWAHDSVYRGRRVPVVVCARTRREANRMAWALVAAGISYSLLLVTTSFVTAAESCDDNPEYHVIFLPGAKFTRS